jgi:Transcriptional activator of glycolytic enzymes
VSPINVQALPISAEAIRSIDHQPEQRPAGQSGEAPAPEQGGQQGPKTCAIPNPPLSGKLGTVKTIWAEWTIGWHGEDGRLNPSIQQLNREYGSSWRKKKHNGNPTGYKKNEYNRKKKVAAAILTLKEQHMASGMPEPQATDKAVNDVEESFKKSGSTHFSRWVDHVLRVKPAETPVAPPQPVLVQTSAPQPASMQAILSQLSTMPLSAPLAGTTPPSVSLPDPQDGSTPGLIPLPLPLLQQLPELQQMLPLGLPQLGAGFPADPMTFQQLLQQGVALQATAAATEQQRPNGTVAEESQVGTLNS